jgi:hypothetical protein
MVVVVELEVVEVVDVVVVVSGGSVVVLVGRVVDVVDVVGVTSPRQALNEFSAIPPNRNSKFSGCWSIKGLMGSRNIIPRLCSAVQWPELVVQRASSSAPVAGRPSTGPGPSQSAGSHAGRSPPQRFKMRSRTRVSTRSTRSPGVLSLLHASSISTLGRGSMTASTHRLRVLRSARTI